MCKTLASTMIHSFDLIINFVSCRVRKILNLRVFDDDGQRWKKSVVDKNLEVLCVSQVE